MSDEPLTSATDYVSYLESQLEKHDQERALLIEEFDKLKSNFGQMHQMRDELRVAARRRDDLTTTNMEDRLVIQEEREKVARLLDENAVLQAQCDDDRVKITSLISLCRGDLIGGVGSGGGSLMFTQQHLHVDPRNAFDAKRRAEQDAADRAARGGTDCIPAAHLPVRKDASTRFPGGTGQSSTTMSLRNVVTDFASFHAHSAAPANVCLTGAEGGPRQPAKAHLGGQFGMVDPRGVVCRNSADTEPLYTTAVGIANETPVGSQLVATLGSEAYHLKQLLDEQRKTYEQDRTRRMQAEQLRLDRYIDSDRKQLKLIAKLEDDVQIAVKELCLYRHQQQIIERSLRGEIEMLKVRCLETQREMLQQNSRKTYDLTLALELATNKNEGAISKLKSELVGKRQAHLSERESQQQQIETLQRENADLRAKLDLDRKLRKREEERYLLERDGMRSEVNQLKQHLRAMEKRMYFSHVKEEQQTSSAAQLLASLVTDQYAQHLANEQNKSDDGHPLGEEGTAMRAKIRRGTSASGRPKRSVSKKRAVAPRHSCVPGGAASCPACGAIEDKARLLSAQRDREARRREPLVANQ